jgi:hypothetical protein
MHPSVNVDAALLWPRAKRRRHVQLGDVPAVKGADIAA